MTVFEIVVLIAALCGVLMVAGGIYLLSKGAITLAATPKATALTIEWKKNFRLNTQVPGLGFFLVGLIFIAIALYVTRPSKVDPIDLSGSVEEAEGPVTIVVGSQRWSVMTSSDGSVRGKIYPDVSVLILEATAPGHEPRIVHVPVGQGIPRTANIGTVKLVKRISEIKPNPARIENVTFELPTVKGVTPTFGAPR